MFDSFDLSKAELGTPLADLSFDANEHFAKPSDQYTTIQDIVQYIENRKETVNIPSESLRVNGELVQDSFEKYLGATDYLSSSFLKKALLTPRHLYYEKFANPKLKAYKNNAKHFELGTFIHQAILEPTKFNRVFVEPTIKGLNKNTVKHHNNVAHTYFAKAIELGVNCEPPKAYQSRDYYKYYSDNVKMLCGLEAISEEDFLKIKAFKQVYEQYGGGIIPELLKHSKREVSMYTEDPETGQKVRIRSDALQFKENIGANAVISVKSTRSDRVGKFMYDSAKLHYDLSEAMYQDVASHVTGRDFDTTIMIMIQTVEPFGVAVIHWTAEDIACGRYKYRNALNNVMEFEEKQLSSSYDTYAEEGNRGIISSQIPEWNKRELEQRNFDW